jgi:hypothetical protein
METTGATTDHAMKRSILETQMCPAVSSPAGEHPTTEGRSTEADSDHGLFGCGSARRDIARRSHRQGRHIRHAPLRAALPVFPLTVAMIETALGAVLMATVGTAPLFAKG